MSYFRQVALAASALLCFSQVYSTSGPSPIPRHECDPSTSGSSGFPVELKPDHFRNLGIVANMTDCVQRCCDVLHCDLAMMSYGGRTCYGVACFNEKLCQMLPAYPTRITFDLAHVYR